MYPKPKCHYPPEVFKMTLPDGLTKKHPEILNYGATTSAYGLYKTSYMISLTISASTQVANIGFL